MAKKTANTAIVITADDVASITTTERKGKGVNHDSGRQRILQILKASEVALAPNQIRALVKQYFDLDIKWVSSHLDYFKKHGQVIHTEDKKYRLAQKMYDTVADINVG